MELNGFKSKNENEHKYFFGNVRSKLEKNESISSLCYAIATACFIIICLMVLQFYGYF
jgi:hypothetical protein